MEGALERRSLIQGDFHAADPIASLVLTVVTPNHPEILHRPAVGETELVALLQLFLPADRNVEEAAPLPHVAESNPMHDVGPELLPPRRSKARSAEHPRQEAPRFS